MLNQKNKHFYLILNSKEKLMRSLFSISCTVRMSEQKLVLWVTRLQSLAFTGKCRDFFHLVCTDWSLSRLLHALGMHREQWKWPSPSLRRRGYVIRNICSVVGVFIYTIYHIPRFHENFLFSIGLFNVKQAPTRAWLFRPASLVLSLLSSHSLY